MSGKFMVSKTFGHGLGLSCIFRQWRDESHCRFLHGYALAVTLRFGCQHLDKNGWVISFGAFSEIKRFLADTFDHKALVAEDDPQLPLFKQMADEGLIQLEVLENGVGCEAFAKLIGQYVAEWLLTWGDFLERGVRIVSVTVREHDANEVTWIA